MSVLAKSQPLNIIPSVENAHRIEQLGEVSKTNEVVHHTSSGRDFFFARWRPTFHLLAPHGWLNDPCGPGYDPSTGKYLLAFQWNPNGNDWGDIAWGHATSYDMVSWDISPSPCLTPSTWYDCLGVFTGCFRPTDINGEADGKLTYVYTSVKNLPIHYTLPYVQGSETLSIAVSEDGGTTWERKPYNPILPGPVQEGKVTGWRDPFLTSPCDSAPESLRQAHTDDDVIYGLISGGLVNHTPTVFVYAVKKTDLTDWKYVGILADPGLNFRPSRWSGDFGKNWEVANLVTLTDDEGTSRDFVIMGTEGCLPPDDESVQDHKYSFARDNRIQRSQLWMCLERNESTSSSSALAKYSYAGIFDNGLYYAANSFWDPVSQQQIVYGWITEEDLPDPIRHRQGWSGLISLPRVLKLNTIHRVKRARATNDLKDITSIEATPDPHGTYTVRTLGIRPDGRLEKLRTTALKHTLSDTLLGPMSTLSCERKTTNFLPLSTLQWEVDIEIAVSKNCSRVGFVVSDPSYIEKTVLFWDPISENFVIERPPILSRNANNDDIKLSQGREVSPHTLFTYSTEPGETIGDAIGKSAEVEETLHIRAIFDVSVLEVFVNERTALSTRIYHAYGARQEQLDVDGHGFGLYFFADPVSVESIENAPSRLLRATVWDGLSVP